MRRILLAAVLLTAGLFAAAPTAAADPPASTFTAVSPVRVLDTRSGGPVGPNATITLDLSSRVPATATAVVLNVTGVTPTASTFVTVYPAGTPRPTASNLNLAPGDIRPNQVTVTLGANRAVSLYNLAGNIHLVADLAGYYGTGTGAKFTALPAARVLDSRQTGGPIGPGGTRVLDLTGRIPPSATAVTFNLTATNATASTVVTAFPTGSARPTTSNVNLPAGDTRANLVTVAVGTNRSVTLFNNAGSVDLAADLAGFYTPDFGAVYLPRNPTRVLDTRTGGGAPLGSLATMPLDLAGSTPLNTTGVLLNITGVDATAPTYVTAWTGGEKYPYISTLNLSAGQIVPNAAMVAFRSSRALKLFNNSGTVHLVADLSGVFVTPDVPCAAGCVRAWGANYDCKLGTGQAVPNSAPAPVLLSDVRAIAPYAGGAYALRNDGTVWAWGDNFTGQLGGAWETETGGSAVPTRVFGLTGVTAIAGGYYNGYALRNDGTVWAWGPNDHGQLGTGEPSYGASPPVQVAGLTGVVAVGAGDSTGFAVRADGTLFGWGSNFYGGVGNGGTGDVWAPVQIMTGVTAVASSGLDGSTYALRTDGTVWAWGLGGGGQLGNGTDTSLSRVPVQVSGLAGVTSIAGGSSNGYAVRNDGTVWAWGFGGDGRLGDGVECVPGANCGSNVPVRVANIADVTKVAAYSGGGYALRADGSVWAWGSNSLGALGNGSVSGYSTVPVRVDGLAGVGAIAGANNSGYVLVP